jgi:serine/threonine protein kinase
VWRAEDHERSIAVKVYHAGDIPMADKAARFRQGFVAMRKLDHAHVVRVHAIYACPLMFSMDYIDGPNFRDWAGATADAEELLSILYTIAETLRHAHSRGVYHRDVKPENVILGRDDDGKWHPHLTDFDLAWFSTASLSTKDALGTVFYAAPEQLAKPGSASAHSPLVDVYSFGQLMYFAVTASDPVPLGMADNVRALAARLSVWGSPEPARLFCGLYSDCASQSASLRPQTMEEVCSRLFAVRRALRPRPLETRLAPGEFVDEVRYALDGRLGGQGETSFSSTTGHTDINFLVDERAIWIRLTLHRRPLIDNVSDFRRAKTMLLERARYVARSYNYRLECGNKDPFHVTVQVPLPCVTGSVPALHDFLVRMLTALERG